MGYYPPQFRPAAAMHLPPHMAAAAMYHQQQMLVTSTLPAGSSAAMNPWMQHQQQQQQQQQSQRQQQQAMPAIDYYRQHAPLPLPHRRHLSSEDVRYAAHSDGEAERSSILRRRPSAGAAVSAAMEWRSVTRQQQQAQQPHYVTMTR